MWTDASQQSHPHCSPHTGRVVLFSSTDLLDTSWGPSQLILMKGVCLQAMECWVPRGWYPRRSTWRAQNYRPDHTPQLSHDKYFEWCWVSSFWFMDLSSMNCKCVSGSYYCFMSYTPGYQNSSLMMVNALSLKELTRKNLFAMFRPLGFFRQNYREL